MMSRFRSHAPWLAGWVVASLTGSFLLARHELTRLRTGFEADASIAHRLLSQRAAQHDTVLSTLSLLRSAGEQVRPEQRLSTTYPQILSVQQRGEEATWPDAILQAAEAESRRTRRAVLADVNFGKGQYRIVMGAEPTSYALVIDIRNMVPWNGWPMPPGASPVRMALEYAGQTFMLQRGNTRGDPANGWDFAFRRQLETQSQPLDVVANRHIAWTELPWNRMLSWSLLVALLLLFARALLRQRSDRQRAHEIFLLGQTARLSTLGELAAGMAQELKQPLSEMLANTRVATRLLDENPPDLLTAQLAMRQSVDQAKRMSELINRLRHAAVQPDRAAQTRALDLEEVTHKALYLLEPELRGHSIATSVERSGPAFLVQAEPAALDQIVHNLLMNAMQALDQVQTNQRKLEIGLSSTQTHGLWSLRDSGTGIPSGVLPHLFEPFFTTHESGLGLGLSLSESLARDMGGTLTAFNRTPRGAEFCLSLPLAAPR